MDFRKWSQNQRTEYDTDKQKPNAKYSEFSERISLAYQWHISNQKVQLLNRAFTGQSALDIKRKLEGEAFPLHPPTVKTENWEWTPVHWWTWHFKCTLSPTGKLRQAIVLLVWVKEKKTHDWKKREKIQRATVNAHKAKRKLIAKGQICFPKRKLKG